MAGKRQDRGMLSNCLFLQRHRCLLSQYDYIIPCLFHMILYQIYSPKLFTTNTSGKHYSSQEPTWVQGGLQFPPLEFSAEGMASCELQYRRSVLTFRNRNNPTLRYGFGNIKPSTFTSHQNNFTTRKYTLGPPTVHRFDR